MSALVLTSFLVIAWGSPQEPASRPPAASPTDVVASLEAAIADAIAKAEPSVVAIHRTKAENSQGTETQAVRGRRRPLNLPDVPRRLAIEGRLRQLPNQSEMISFDFGSGVVIGNKGEILTLFHVVRGARELTVRAAGRQEFDAEIVAADPRSDLAVIAPTDDDRLDAPKLKPIALGDADKLRKGSFVITLGNPFNAARDGTPSASWGILSNVARRLDFDADDFPVRALRSQQPRLNNYPTLLQLDAKLNLGMSGGAVINLKGELVGITTMASSPSGFDAMAGYAIPMDKLGRRAAETLKKGKEIEYGMLGIKADNSMSNRVGELTANSPANGKLQNNDEIIAVNDTPVFDFDSIILAVNAYSAGETIRLKIRRGDETLVRTLTLAKYHVEGEVIATNRPKPWRGLRIDYTTINNRTWGNIFDAPVRGVVISEVEEGSAAAAAGLKKGQLISRVGDTEIHSPPSFNQAVAGLDGPVVLQTDLGPVTIK
jgi:serine protease Do